MPFHLTIVLSVRLCDLWLLITPLMSSSFSQQQKVVYWGRLHQYLVVGLMLSNVLTIHCIVLKIIEYPYTIQYFLCPGMVVNFALLPKKTTMSLQS